MGRAKWDMMEEEERGFSTTEGKWVCAQMFPLQKLLKERIEQGNLLGICDYSGQQGYVMTLGDIVPMVLGAMEEVFESPDDSLPFESHDDIWDDLEGSGLHKEGAGYILPDGYSIMTTKEALLDVGFVPESDELLDDICSCISNNDWVYKDLIDITDDQRLIFNWDTFWESTIKQARDGKSYEEIRKSNARRLDFMTESIRRNYHSLVKSLPKGTELYRCVNYTSPLPDSSNPSFFWAPPHEKASSQRMSRKGQSRFYASFDKKAPLLEAVINKEGETKCLSTFKLKQEVRIFDFFNVPEARLLNCPDVLAYRFFNKFADAITQPIGEDKDLYVPTQIMRDIIEDNFSRNYSNEEDIMGITYRSVKASSGHSTSSVNIVMFLDNTTCTDYLCKTTTEFITE